jgi:hypothetical protein
MGLKGGVYIVFFPPYDEHDEHYGSDDDHYTSWCYIKNL